MCGPHNLKSLLSDPLQKIIADPDIKEGISNILEGKTKERAYLKTKHLIHATEWMNLEKHVLSERSQSQRTTFV